MPVVEPSLTFASVTDKISSIVLKRKTPLWWFIGFAISFVLFQLMLLAITNLVFVGIGLWGVNVPVAWGIDILNFRLVDRYRPRRHVDFGDSAIAETRVAHLDQPLSLKR